MVQFSHPYMTTGKTIALTRWTFVGKVMSLLFIRYLGLFSCKEQASFNFMAAVTICSDFGAHENKVCHCFHCFPIYLLWKASLQTKLVEGIEFQLSYSKSWKMMLWKCCTQYASTFGKLSSGHRTGKGQFSFQSQRQCQRMLKLPHNCTHLTR